MLLRGFDLQVRRAAAIPAIASLHSARTRLFFHFLPNGACLGADLLDVAFLVRSLSLLVSLARFKRHGLVADWAFQESGVRLTEDAIEGDIAHPLLF